jgi:hypothetical protein
MRIPELKFKDVPDAAIVLCIGRRKSGKTVNIIDIFFKKRESFKFGLVFCGSKATIKLYENHFPSSFIYYGYHPTVLADAIAKQEQDVEMGCAKPMFILVDDCMWDKKGILKDPNIRRVFMNGRHDLIFFVLSMQYCMDIPPDLRQQVDFTFLSREKNPDNRERLYNNYNVCFTSNEQFDSCMQQCTQNHETFVLSNASETDSDKPEDNVYWWKSKWLAGGRKFRVHKDGTWWKYHRKRYNPKHFMIKNDMVVKNHNKGFTVTKLRARKVRKPQPAYRGMKTGGIIPRPTGGEPLREQPFRRTCHRQLQPIVSPKTPQAKIWIQNQRELHKRRRGAFENAKYKQIDTDVRYASV